MGRVLDWISWANYRVFKWSTKRWKRLVKRRILELEHELDILGHWEDCPYCIANMQLNSVRLQIAAPINELKDAVSHASDRQLVSKYGGWRYQEQMTVWPKPKHYRLDYWWYRS